MRYTYEMWDKKTDILGEDAKSFLSKNQHLNHSDAFIVKRDGVICEVQSTNIIGACYPHGLTGNEIAKKYTDDLNIGKDNFENMTLLKEQATKISILSEKVDAQTVENTKVEESQNRQDREIIDSLLASTELFEMVMAMMPVTINTKENERVNGMVTVYVTLILKGVKTIEDVPAVIRPQVQEQLDLLLK